MLFYKEEECMFTVFYFILEGVLNKITCNRRDGKILALLEYARK
jgi:hypothetical protein